MGGEGCDLLTPNRVGVSQESANVFTTFNEDANHNIGSNFTRAGQFRAAYHFNDQVVWALALENPQQFTGQGAEVPSLPHLMQHWERSLTLAPTLEHPTFSPTLFPSSSSIINSPATGISTSNLADF